MNSYNPDVLSCLASLSNDEVFTPPKVANEMLDLLPQEIWNDKAITFLDPFCKSGVFLREIARRLLVGLEKDIPDLQERVNHIFTKQIFGIAITELTSHLSRRSAYCTKTANGEYSVCTIFENEKGNILFDKIAHTWKNRKCTYCGANQDVYDRGKDLESHAYQFIHTQNPEEIFNMKFDVIVGNPPYQLNDGGGTGSSAMPIYDKFVEQAKKLNPRYLTMIIPARWFSGGRGLDSFRDGMLKDKSIRVLHDFINVGDCFPGVEIKGGVCYFLWDKNYKGDCKIYTHYGNNNISESFRPLLEKNVDTFIRHNEAISILKKIQQFNEETFSKIVSPNDVFGFDVRVENSYKRINPNFMLEPFETSVKFYYNGWKKDGIGYIDKNTIKKNSCYVDKHKVFIPKAWGTGNMSTDRLNPFVGEPNSCCTETYLLIGPLPDEKISKNVISYIQTSFFHFMVSFIKITQNSMQKVYSLVPIQDFSESWTDEKLYKKYGLTHEEIDFIESMIKPMI